MKLTHKLAARFSAIFIILLQAIRRGFTQPVLGLALWRILLVSAGCGVGLIWQKDSAQYSTCTILFGLWALSAAWSLSVVFTRKLRLTRFAATREVIIDIIWVSVLIYFSGRTANPFIYYLLVIVALASVVLSAARAWFVCLMTILVYSVLLRVDTSHHFDHLSEEYQWHMIGMWINYVGSSVVVCLFITQLMRSIREQQQHLENIREDNLKQEQLIGLATVSATTVHELATPLSTLTILVDDLSSAVTDDLKNDIELLRQQVERCQSTIKNLSTLADSGITIAPQAVGDLFDDLQYYFSLHRPGHAIEFINRAERNTQVAINQLFRYALINLMNNAAQYSLAEARVEFRVCNQVVEIEINNAVAGQNLELIDHWGRPVTEGFSGVGIGSFLANSTIEQLGGRVSVRAIPHSTNLDQKILSVLVALNALGEACD